MQLDEHTEICNHCAIPNGDHSMTQPSDKYGCHNRPPIKTFGNPQCQYTYTLAGQTDKRCDGCKHKEVQEAQKQ